MFFKEKIFSGPPWGVSGAPRIAKVMGSSFFQKMNSIVNVWDFLVQYHETRLPYTCGWAGAVMWGQGLWGVPYAQHQFQN